MLASAQVEAGRDTGEVRAEQAARRQDADEGPFLPPVLPDEAGTFGG